MNFICWLIFPKPARLGQNQEPRVQYRFPVRALGTQDQNQHVLRPFVHPVRQLHQEQRNHLLNLALHMGCRQLKWYLTHCIKHLACGSERKPNDARYECAKSLLLSIYNKGKLGCCCCCFHRL